MSISEERDPQYDTLYPDCGKVRPMSAGFAKFRDPLMKLGEKFAQNKTLQILRDAFMLAFPLTIFGSITLVIANFPFLDKILGEQGAATLNALLGPASTATMSIATVFTVLGIGYYFSKDRKCDPIFGAAISLAAFIMITPMEVEHVLEDGTAVMVGSVLAIDRLGARGMFVGMLAAFLAAFLYCWITKKNWTIKMPASVPPAVSKSFSALIPACLTLTVFLAVRIGFTFTPWGNIHDFIYELVQAPLTSLGSSLIATLLAIFSIQILWFFGLHGQIIVNSVLDPIWNTLTMENLMAFQAGEALPNIVTKQFIEIFTVGIGGSGMTLAAVIILAFFCRSRQLKQMGRLALPAACFNINEPIIFGLPIVLNPTILIPWILAPVINVCIVYFAMATGLVPLTTGVTVPWTTPIFLSGMLATNSWQGGVIQLVELAVVFVCWLPFLKALDRTALQSDIQEEDDSVFDLGDE